VKSLINFGAILTVLLLVSCGEHIDSTEKLQAGYKFRKDSVFYMKINRIGKDDSIKYTLKDFTILDTFPEFERYIIGDSQAGHRFRIPDKLGNGGAGGTVETPHTFNYGAANFNGEIVIFPRFWQWVDLGNGYFGVRKYRNTNELGVLHIRGEMITDIKYESLAVDSLTHQIICGYRVNENLLYDTIDVQLGN
jgi:hypothetical protein